MRSSSPRSLLLTGAAGLGLSLLSALPAAAHGHADASGLAGALHPLLGLDHLVLLVGIGLCAADSAANCSERRWREPWPAACWERLDWRCPVLSYWRPSA